MRNNTTNTSTSYKPLVGYYLLICFICSFSLSLYSFIKILFEPIVIDSTNNNKYYNMNFIINTLAFISTGQYIFIIFMTLCNVFNYNTSLILYNIFHYNYVMFNIISVITFVSHIDSFNFFKENYNYYYISLIIQFSICSLSIILELFVCCCQPKKIHYIRIQNNTNRINDTDN